MAITLFHNPACGTSRKVLELIRASGAEPHIVEYLQHPPTRDELTSMLRDLHLTPRELLRTQEAEYAELGLDDASLSDQRLVDAMVEHPILMNRPIVRTPRGIKLCRPAEEVNALL
ncbi:arsenate reductase (glutaredoxin) [Paraburkholderia sp. CNPSo 3157]|uniref:Arsenate reductase n=1 Tax=Paraburkholderia franconis TaxID=2654983 RepID=A0A7X1NIG9_9BURK|nr:arsenate reductase (glutaredoxin) [Paraburkholderia franconis]MPW22534.1 arsenate reductase (glutaredoxin) [Paraburkholderia franconis]